MLTSFRGPAAVFVLPSMGAGTISSNGYQKAVRRMV